VLLGSDSLAQYLTFRSFGFIWVLKLCANSFDQLTMIFFNLKRFEIQSILMFLYLDCFIAHDIHNTVGVNLCDHFWTEIN
jgi:hypothetical protein